MTKKKMRGEKSAKKNCEGKWVERRERKKKKEKRNMFYFKKNPFPLLVFFSDFVI